MDGERLVKKAWEDNVPLVGMYDGLPRVFVVASFKECGDGDLFLEVLQVGGKSASGLGAGLNKRRFLLSKLSDLRL